MSLPRELRELLRAGAVESVTERAEPRAILRQDEVPTPNPDERAVHYERGKLNLARKDYVAARRDAERALDLRDPGGLVLDLQLYYLLATVYARLGESALARKYAELARTTPIPDQAGDRPR